jgi:hypothetical protein
MIIGRRRNAEAKGKGENQSGPEGQEQRPRGRRKLGARKSGAEAMKPGEIKKQKAISLFQEDREIGRNLDQRSA